MKPITRRSMLRWLAIGGLAGAAYGVGSSSVGSSLSSLVMRPFGGDDSGTSFQGEVTIMGVMPYSIEKGVIGLRMDYVTRSLEVRKHALTQLAAGEDPFSVAANISVNGIEIDLFRDKRSDFAAKLDQLLGEGEGARYVEQQASQLHPRNQDTTGNRDAFVGYWIVAARDNPDFKEVLRRELQVALSSDRPVDFWWECSLPEGSPATVKTSLEFPEVARVFFRTDSSAVEAGDLSAREPLDT